HLLRSPRRAPRIVRPPRRDRARGPLHLSHRGLWRRVPRGARGGVTMRAFTPSSPAVVGILAGLLLATLLAGFALTRLRRIGLARALAWALVIGAAFVAERIVRDEAAGVRMLAICAVTLFAMKGVVSVEDQAQGGARLAPAPWFAFAAGWPGMRPQLFQRLGGPDARSRELLRRGLVRLALGALLVGLARLAWIGSGSRALTALLLLPGVSLVLHFGLFNL